MLEAAFADMSLRVFEADFAYRSVDDFLAAYETTGRFRLAVANLHLPADGLPASVRTVAAERFAAQGCLPSPVRMGVFLATAG